MGWIRDRTGWDATLPRRRRKDTEADRLRYEKGDRVWVRSGLGSLLPGVVIGHHKTWDLYRVAYMVDVAGRGPRAIEEWRLSPRSKDEPPVSDTL